MVSILYLEAIYQIELVIIWIYLLAIRYFWIAFYYDSKIFIKRIFNWSI